MEKLSRILHDLDQGNINVELAKKSVLDLFFESNSFHFEKGAKAMRDMYIEQKRGGNELPRNGC